MGAIACLGLLIGAGPAGAAAHRRMPRLHAQIVGGQSAPTGSLPQLALVVDQVSASAGYLCTGTVLSSNVVLTAGHCAEDETTGALEPTAGFHVVTGRLDWSDTSIGQVSGVSQVIVNPGYDPTTHVDDAALLVLSTPTTAPAITLANGSDASLWQPPTRVAIAGWGLTDGSDPDSIPTQLQWATTVTQPASYCELQASLGGIGFNPDLQLCTVNAPTYDTGTCNGDSGGPVLGNYWGTQPVEVGITSLVPSGCTTGQADFFTRADAISAWAANWVNDVAPGPIPTPTPTPAAPPSEPLAGIYTGQTSQHRQLKLQVSPAQTAVSRYSIASRLRCHDGRQPVYVSSIEDLPLGQLRFGATVHGRHGLTEKVAGTFNTTGGVAGTFSIVVRNTPHGYCHAGPLRWSAAS